MNRLILVRHAHVHGIEPPTFRGQHELDLSGEGRTQLPLVGSALACWAPISAVMSSPRRRAFDTATAITQEVSGAPQADPAFDDIHYGQWTGRSQADVARDEPTAWQAWQLSPSRFRFVGGESLLDVQARAAKAVEQRLEQISGMGSLVVVSHDATLRTLLCYFMGLPLDGYRRWRLDPASITILEFGGHGVSLAALNDTSHLRINHRHPRNPDKETA